MDPKNPEFEVWARVADELLLVVCDLRDRVCYMCGVCGESLSIEQIRSLRATAYALGQKTYNLRCYQEQWLFKRVRAALLNVSDVRQFYPTLFKTFPTFRYFIEESLERLLAVDAAFRLLLFNIGGE